MQDHLQTTLVVQVETVGGQYLSARLLAPWRSHVVGREWKDIEHKLQAKAVRELRSAIPRKWLMSDPLAALPMVAQASVKLEPPERLLAWQEPIEVALETFRWEMPDGMCLVKVPAVHCDLYGPSTDIDDVVVNEQIRVALVRLGDRYDLWDVRKRFFQRSFSYRLITVQSPLKGHGAAKQSKAESAKSLLAEQRRQTVTLRAVASDLSRAQLEPVFGRNSQAIDVAEYLSGQTPQSVLLVGPAGVGKTAIVHQLVHLMSQADTPQTAAPASKPPTTKPAKPADESTPAITGSNDLQLSAVISGLRGRKIWSTTGSRLVSGMSGMGMWQERCLKLIREAHATHGIVHVGSVTELMEAGKIEGQPGVASMVRQAVARGRLVIIGECTPEQIALIEREEPLLLRSMVRYDVTEPAPAEVTSILRQAAEYRTTTAARKQSRRCTFTESALEELNGLHRRYASYSALPAQPLRLMQSILERSAAGSVIDAAEVARAFATQTGLPRFLVDDSVTIDLERIRTRLASHVIGQSEPVDLVVNLIATLKSRMVRPGRPLASLLFIGPTGVGKTEMAKALAGLLYSDTRRMVRIDMSEYASPWSAVRLIGRPDEGDGTLTSPIREQPFSVVLLDEFEKADPTVFDMLLQLLGEGRLTDSLGRLADFRNAVVIMTSNLGVESFRESGFGFGEGGSDWRSHFQREVQRFVRPELLGRIDRIVPFAPLPRDIVRQIAQREIDLLKERPGLKYADLRLKVTPEVIDHLCQLGYQPKYGARPLRRAIEQHLTVPLANKMSELSSSQSWELNAQMAQNQIMLSATRLDGDGGQLRRTAESAIDTWQSLGRMARMALNCAPLRDLENETERLQRINDSLFDKLKETTQTRRVNNLKEEIQQNAVHIERNKRLAQTLSQASQQIIAAHQGVLLDWYRNTPINQERLFEWPIELQLELRTAVVGLLEGRTKNLENVTLLIVGKPISRAAVLWQAYEQIALENHWKVDYYTLKNYEAARDRESPEYRKRQSQRKAEELDTNGDNEPSMRLLGRQPGAELGAQVKTCDAYREVNSQAWLTADGSVAAIALQIVGYGVQAWLGNEHGIMHFVDTNASGPKRRQRFRVVVEPQRLLDVTLNTNWTEPSGQPERDPRRTFNLAENLVYDGLTMLEQPCSQSKLVDCLIEAIRNDREALLWSAIDFAGIPPSATLQGDSPSLMDFP